MSRNDGGGLLFYYPKMAAFITLQQTGRGRWHESLFTELIMFISLTRKIIRLGKRRDPWAIRRKVVWVRAWGKTQTIPTDIQISNPLRRQVHTHTHTHTQNVARGQACPWYRRKSHWIGLDEPALRPSGAGDTVVTRFRQTFRAEPRFPACQLQPALAVLFLVASTSLV